MSESLKSLLELFEKGDFVEFGKNYKNWNNKEEVAKRIYQVYEPVKKSEKFFDLNEWDVNKLAFAVAVKAVSKGLAMSQIRKILSMSSKLYRKLRRKTDISSDIVKLSYILAYTMGRQRRGEIEPVAEVLSKVLPKTTEENYERVHTFLQAVVAYHKLLGGRD